MTIMGGAPPPRQSDYKRPIRLPGIIITRDSQPVEKPIPYRCGSARGPSGYDILYEYSKLDLRISKTPKGLVALLPYHAFLNRHTAAERKLEIIVNSQSRNKA